jgi:protein required for attachment to host cells
MQTTWTLVADSSRARIFEQHGTDGTLAELEDFINPAGRAADTELGADEKGRFYGKGERYQSHTAEPAVTPHEHQTQLFANSVIQYLEHAHGEHRFHRLSLIAPAKFLGLIRADMSKELHRLVVEEMSKDISGWSRHEIEIYLKAKHGEPGDAV